MDPLPDQPEAEATKRCTRCGEARPPNQFTIRRDGIYRHKDTVKRKAWCKSCVLAYKRGTRPSVFSRVAKKIRQRGGAMYAIEVKEALGRPGSCYLCGRPVDEADVQLDHVMPVFHGGKSVAGNLRWAHSLCNMAKGRLTLEDSILQGVNTLAFQIKEDPNIIFEDPDVREAVQRINRAVNRIDSETSQTSSQTE